MSLENEVETPSRSDLTVLGRVIGTYNGWDGEAIVATLKESA